MKSKPGEKSSENFAFDDDTSDSDDDDQLDAFNSRVGSLKPPPKPLIGNKVDSSDEESEDEESEEEYTDDSEDDEESETESSLKPKLSDEKLAKLTKLQAQLAGMSKDEDDDDDEDEDSEEDSSGEEGDQNRTDALVKEQDGEVESKSEKLKRPAEEQSQAEDENNAKKLKLVEVNPEDKERRKYREKLTKMSIEDIQKLKERLGLKLFHQKMSGTAPMRGQKMNYKRENKNRPREMSSKKTVGRHREVVQVAKVEKRDPRFDPLCGEFDEKLFKDNYKFVNEMKSQDLTFLKKQIREEEDPERRKSIKYLIQRTENQLRQEAQNKVKEQEEAAEKNEKKDQLNAGVNPFYVSKSKQKEIKLVDQYEKLKKSGGLDNYIRKKTKKNLVKDRKKFERL